MPKNYHYSSRRSDRNRQIKQLDDAGSDPDFRNERHGQELYKLMFAPVREERDEYDPFAEAVNKPRQKGQWDPRIQAATDRLRAYKKGQLRNAVSPLKADSLLTLIVALLYYQDSLGFAGEGAKARANRREANTPEWQRNLQTHIDKIQKDAAAAQGQANYQAWKANEMPEARALLLEAADKALPVVAEELEGLVNEFFAGLDLAVPVSSASDSEVTLDTVDADGSMVRDPGAETVSIVKALNEFARAGTSEGSTGSLQHARPDSAQPTNQAGNSGRDSGFLQSASDVLRWGTAAAAGGVMGRSGNNPAAGVLTSLLLLARGREAAPLADPSSPLGAAGSPIKNLPAHQHHHYIGTPGNLDLGLTGDSDNTPTSAQTKIQPVEEAELRRLYLVFTDLQAWKSNIALHDFSYLSAGHSLYFGVQDRSSYVRVVHPPRGGGLILVSVKEGTFDHQTKRYKDDDYDKFLRDAKTLTKDIVGSGKPLTYRLKAGKQTLGEGSVEALDPLNGNNYAPPSNTTSPPPSSTLDVSVDKLAARMWIASLVKDSGLYNKEKRSINGESLVPINYWYKPEANVDGSERRKSILLEDAVQENFLLNFRMGSIERGEYPVINNVRVDWSEFDGPRFSQLERGMPAKHWRSAAKRRQNHEQKNKINDAANRKVDATHQLDLSLLNPTNFAEKVGENIRLDHGIEIPFNMNDVAEIKFTAWSDSPWEYIKTGSPLAYIVHFAQGKEASELGFLPQSKSLNITHGDLILGNERKRIGFNTYDLEYPPPADYFKELVETDLPVEYEKELEAFFSHPKHRNLLQKSFEFKFSAAIKNREVHGRSLIDYDPLRRLAEGKAQIYEVKVNEFTLGYGYQAEGVLNFVDAEEQLNLIVFPGTGRSAWAGSYKPDQIYVSDLRDIVELLHSIGNLQKLRATIKLIPDRILNDPKWDKYYGPETMRELRALNKVETRGDRGNGFGVTVSRSSETSLSEQMDKLIKSMQDDANSKMDEISTSKSELHTLTVLHRIEFAGGVLATALYLGALIPGSQSAGLAAAGLINAIATTTGVQLTKAAIADNSPEAIEAITRWVSVSVTEFYGYILGDVGQPISAAVKKHISHVIGKRLCEVWGVAATSLGLEYSALVSNELVKLNLPAFNPDHMDSN